MQPQPAQPQLQLRLINKPYYRLYRNRNNPNEIMRYYMSSRQAFSGWHFQWQWQGLPQDQLPPKTFLVITPRSRSKSCRVRVKNRGNKHWTQESVFSLAANARDIIINPDINFSKTARHGFTCRASIQAIGYYQGQTIHSNKINLRVRLNQSPSVPHRNRYIRITSSGLKTLPNQRRYRLPIYIMSPDNYLAIPGRRSSGIRRGKATDRFHVYVGSSRKVSLMGNTTLPDKKGCVYFPRFKRGNQQGETLSVRVPNSARSWRRPLLIKAQWQYLCPQGFKNQQYTLSGALQTRKRFQYGTFQVTMKPSHHPGVNSTFYTYYGNSWIPAKNIYPYGDRYHWSYTLHELDFEFIPGLERNSLPPLRTAFGFNRPYISAATLAQQVLINAFSPGSVVKGRTNPQEHFRVCPNPNDAACLIKQFNPYDDQFHTYTMTWTPHWINYYFDGQLANRLKIENPEDGIPIVTQARQQLFNQAMIQGANGNAYPTSPQFIAVNFWVPQKANGFGARLLPLTQDQRLLTNYKSIAWSPCVLGGKFTTSCPLQAHLGRVYDSKGQLLPLEQQHDYQWLFTTMDKTALNQDWLYAPLIKFDHSNTYFVQNNVLLDASGLHLCMQTQWDHMAWRGKPSQGCDGHPLLPPPGSSRTTGLQQALIVIKAHFASSVPRKQQQAWLHRIARGIIPKAPLQGTAPRFINKRWGSQQQHACTRNSRNKQPACDPFSWLADPRFESINNRLEGTYLVYISTIDNQNQPFPPYKLQPSNPIRRQGKTYHVTYHPTQLQLKPQHTYFVTATLQ